LCVLLFLSLYFVAAVMANKDLYIITFTAYSVCIHQLHTVF